MRPRRISSCAGLGYLPGPPRKFLMALAARRRQSKRMPFPAFKVNQAAVPAEPEFFRVKCKPLHTRLLRLDDTEKGHQIQSGASEHLQKSMLTVLRLLVMAVAALAEKVFLADLRPAATQNPKSVLVRGSVRKWP